MPKKKPPNEITGNDGRSRLQEVAMKLFAEKGFDGVTVRDIAAAANVSVGLINHHFGSKEGLREAVDNHIIQQFAEVLAAQSESEARSNDFDSTVAWIEGWISRHLGEWDATVGYMRRALLEDSEWGSSLFQRFYQIARTSIDRMDADGRIRPDVDRLWLPFLMVYLELGTLLLEPHIKRILGRSGFERELWRRRYTAYLDLIVRGAGYPSPK